MSFHGDRWLAMQRAHRREIVNRRWRYAMFACFLLGVWLGRACDASAQDDATALILAQSAVAEATWREADHRGVMHVIRKRAERAGVPLQAMAVRYVAAFDARTVPTARLRWVMQLNLTATRPAAFPRNLSWAAHVDRWLAVVALARKFVADPSSVPDPCEEATHWGGKMDLPRGRMVRARCVEATANTFLRVRRR